MRAENEETLSTREAAKRLGVQIDMVYKLVWSGVVDAKREDGRWMISAASVEHYAANRRRKPALEEADAVAV